MKNTMRNVLGNLLCPLFCLSCGKCGDILCDCCKKNMSFSHGMCLECGHKLNGFVCLKCDLPFCFQFCLGERKGILKELINDFKYNSNKAAGLKLVEVLADSLILDQNAVLVPLPTIVKHKRERGFGQTEWFAGKLSRVFGCDVSSLLSRAKNTVQVGASSDKRKIQAEEAYMIQGAVDAGQNYVLFDDVWTTGSSMLAAAKLLKDHGANNVSALLLAKTI